MADGAPDGGRAATLPARIQARLTGWYGIDEAPPVDDFVEPADDARETLLVRESGGELELGLRLPRAALERGGRATFDELCQVIEGVSHFLYLAERARRELPATQLELELQAEVDKYVTCLLVSELEASPVLRRRLFGDCEYDGDLDRDEFERYRAANDNAMRYSAYLESTFVAPRRIPEMLAELRRFYREGLAAKLTRARGYR